MLPYIVLARHDASGEPAGLTQAETGPELPEWAFQALTAVAREHRGHRLGLRLKLAMMDLLARRERGVRHILIATPHGALIRINRVLGVAVRMCLTRGSRRASRSPSCQLEPQPEPVPPVLRPPRSAPEGPFGQLGPGFGLGQAGRLAAASWRASTIYGSMPLQPCPRSVARTRGRVPHQLKPPGRAGASKPARLSPAARPGAPGVGPAQLTSEYPAAGGLPLVPQGRPAVRRRASVSSARRISFSPQVAPDDRANARPATRPGEPGQQLAPAGVRPPGGVPQQRWCQPCRCRAGSPTRSRKPSAGCPGGQLEQVPSADPGRVLESARFPGGSPIEAGLQPAQTLAAA